MAYTHFAFSRANHPAKVRRMRVAYLFERFPSFGQTFCYREVAELMRQGADLSIFSIRRPSDEPAQNWDAQILRRITYLPGETELVKEIERAVKRGELPEAALRSLREWDRQPDFLRLYQAAFIGLRMRVAGLEHMHAHFAGMAARTAYWLRKFFGIRYSLTVHANDIFTPREFAIGLEKLFDEADAIVTVSDFAVAQLRTRFPQNAAKFRRVYNGLELGGFKAAEFREDAPRIISIGRLIEKKGFGDLISACGILRKRGVKFHCEIVGEGPLAETLATQIAREDLQDCVSLVGPKTQDEIVELLGAARLFVLACCRTAEGDMDNLPTVIMEAMAAGLPVVSTTLAGVPEMVADGVTGRLVSPNESSALAQAMENFLVDRELARAFGARGREMATEKFSLANNVAALAKILRMEKRAPA